MSKLSISWWLLFILMYIILTDIKHMSITYDFLSINQSTLNVLKIHNKKLSSLENKI